MYSVRQSLGKKKNEDEKLKTGETSQNKQVVSLEIKRNHVKFKELQTTSKTYM